MSSRTEAQAGVHQGNAIADSKKSNLEHTTKSTKLLQCEDITMIRRGPKKKGKKKKEKRKGRQQQQQQRAEEQERGFIVQRATLPCWVAAQTVTFRINE